MQFWVNPEAGGADDTGHDRPDSDAFPGWRILAQYSDAAIAAAGPAGMSSWLLISLFNGAAGFTTTFVAQYRAPADQTISALPSGKAYFGIVTGLIIALFGTFSATRYSL